MSDSEVKLVEFTNPARDGEDPLAAIRRVYPARRYRIYMPSGESATLSGSLAIGQIIGATVTNLIVSDRAQDFLGSPLGDGDCAGVSMLAWIIDDESGEEAYNPRRYEGPLQIEHALWLAQPEHAEWPSFTSLIDPPDAGGRTYVATSRVGALAAGKGYVISDDGLTLQCFECGSNTGEELPVKYRYCPHCVKTFADGEEARAAALTRRRLTELSIDGVAVVENPLLPDGQVFMFGPRHPFNFTGAEELQVSARGFSDLRTSPRLRETTRLSIRAARAARDPGIIGKRG